MALTVTDITDWSVARRWELLEQFMADLHPGSYEDFRWNAAVFDMDAKQCLDLFSKAERLGLVSDELGPVYLFAVGGNRYLSTLSTTRREQLKLSLTKAIRRWAATEAGVAFLTGTYGAADVSDIEDGHLPKQWPEIMGYVYRDTVAFNGKQINRYAFQGV